MRSRKPMRSVALVSVIVVLASLGAARAGESQPSSSSSSGPASPGVGLPAALVARITPAVSRVAVKIASVRPATNGKAVRVMVIGSGVDTGVFPESLRSKIKVQSGGGDAAGHGTYAAGALLQSLRDVSIVSWSVYDGDRFSAARQKAAFDWALKNSKKIDAVLYAVPGSEFVDPATLLLSTPASQRESSWTALLTAVGDAPLRTKRGKAVFGAATAGDARSNQRGKLDGGSAGTLDRWASAVERWRSAREQLSALAKKGLPVVAPAGDLGPNYQTIFGIANLPEVIAVGAFDGRGVARTSSSGPSLDNHVKPDLIAPAGLVGVLPVASTLAKKLPWNERLKPEWFTAAAPLTKARVRVDSTIASAAVVAAQIGSLYSQGIHDQRVLRGALVLASSPLSGTPVWRQGAGVLSRMVTAKQVAAMGVPLAPAADFGLEPAGGGRWARRVGFWRAKPSASKVTLAHTAGVAADGRAFQRPFQDPGLVSASVGNDGVTYTTGIGERYDAGLYCGYATVAIPRTSQDFRPNVSGDGLPPGAREHLPTCLLNGKRLSLFGFYIHDEPAENLTFALMPDLPERETVMSAFPKHLPIDPFGERLFQRVTGADGMAYLSNVPPGYFRFRQFSDYGNPVQFQVQDSDGAAKSVHQEIGENPSYQDVPAFLLSATGMTEQDLKDRFGAENVAKEKPTGAYLITIGTQQIRVVLDYFKKMPGPAVASRYVDLLERDDFRFGVVPEPMAMKRLADGGLTDGVWPLAADGWLIEGENAPKTGSQSSESIAARYNALRSTTDARIDDILGVAQYPFGLTQPNYKTHLSLSFGYEIQNAAVVAVIQAGKDVEVAVLGDAGVVRFDGSSDNPLANITPMPSGTTGVTSFNVDLLSRDAKSGLLTLLFVPSPMLSREALPVARVELRDLSMRISTWQRILWPATMTPQGQGHAFEVSPNVSAAQMNHPACRDKTVTGYSYRECEAWDVIVHSPGEDAETTAVRRGGADETTAIRDAGGTLFDPRRGIADFSSTLTHALALPAVNAGLNLSSEFRTNGRFWEQLLVPWAYLKGHPGRLRFEITDNAPGRASVRFPHRLGGVAVAPYLPYRAESSALDATTVVDDLMPSALRETPVATAASAGTQISPADIEAAHRRNAYVCDLL